ncbi:tubulin polyglutamylase TTLL5 [Callorhinchus milii]|uniref:tubulin polyglutamylase TTLL5 n=1 Tax=Callorhinchus milii TaxID=7868 RepID=UPI001C3F969E|nr:tubulin polyglutamylase TTLL5 [Callorhinchus milii]XP_042193803.1 tubulin polyglutamylase TTLL5 [Callorhinchus milii]XP_042193804.1 tubulin polyglutamylase TTLL5 [Callorhinchus milii]
MCNHLWGGMSQTRGPHHSSGVSFGPGEGGVDVPVMTESLENGASSTEDEDLEEHPCIQWTGSSHKIPIFIFHAEGIVTKDTALLHVGNRYHLSFKIVRTESRLVRNILSAHGFQEVNPNSNDFNLMWTGTHLKPQHLRTLLDFQKVNHFPRSYELTRKDRLYKNIQRMQQLHGFKNFSIVPQTFVLPTEFQELYNANMKDKGPWIVKPVASSRGRGVYLVSNPVQIITDESILVSRYIRSPLLIDGFKFDMRLYVLVTSYEPLVVYLYEEGLTRFATVKYDHGMKNIRNQFMHLTNYSINKKSLDYVSCDDPEVEDYGNKWSMSAMLRYLKQEGRDTMALMAQIEDLVIKTIIAAELPIATACKMFVPHRRNCFELYGFDVLVDSSMKPWLLEVNLSPSLACDAPLDLKIKASMLSDMFTLVGFVCHNPMARHVKSMKTSFNFPTRSQAHRVPQRPMSASTMEPNSKAAPGKETAGGVQAPSCLGLTLEQVKLVRNVKEENDRRGGFLRIFPTAHTWKLYGPYMEHKTPLNYLLVSNLFPDRVMKQVVSARARSGTESALDVLGVDSWKHAVQYERKLLSLDDRRRRRRRQKYFPSQKLTEASRILKKSPRAGVEWDVEENEEDEESSAEEAEVCGLAALQPLGGSKTVRLTLSNLGQAVGEQAWTQAKQQEPSRSQPKLLERLQKDRSLSKVQARLAFSAYLRRVQLRLAKDSKAPPSGQEDEQMELVIRFLKRAASNLHHTIKVIFPSQRLPVSERRYILAQQLADFIHCYNKETDQMVQRSQMELKQENCVQQEEFQAFVSEASESDLEEVLTFYTRRTKSASVFLGSQVKEERPESRSQLCEGSNPQDYPGPKQGQSKVSNWSVNVEDLPAHSSLIKCIRLNSSQHVYLPSTALDRAETLHQLPSVAPILDQMTFLNSNPSQGFVAGARATSLAGRPGSTTSPSHPTQIHDTTQYLRTGSHYPEVPSSSLQAAAPIYDQKYSRPISAIVGLGEWYPQRQRPGSAGLFGEGDHRPTHCREINNEAISSALRRLTEKQAARQYAPSSHVTLLTQHLSNMNLTNGAPTRSNVVMVPAARTPGYDSDPVQGLHTALQTPNCGGADRTTSTASR